MRFTGHTLLFLIIVAIFFHLQMPVLAQSSQDRSNTTFTFGDGISFTSSDGNFQTTFGTRFQFNTVFEELDGTMQGSTPDEYRTTFLLRRFRITLRGDLKEQGVDFYFQPSFDRSEAGIRHAFVRWNVAGDARLWFGRNKIPLTREHMNSFLRLQFVERSLTDDIFKADFDTGIGFENSTGLAGARIRQEFAVSSGDGFGNSSTRSGLAYTGKITLLPFGEFSGKGDLAEPDLAREAEPKLAVGAGFSFNNNSTRALGTRGSQLSPASTDLSTVHADAIFKYRGLSLSGAYSKRRADLDSPQVFEGEGLKVQGGYMLADQLEIAFRRAALYYDESFGNRESRTVYTAGINRYFLGHSLKTILNGSYRIDEENGGSEERVIIQFQIQLHI